MEQSLKIKYRGVIRFLVHGIVAALLVIVTSIPVGAHPELAKDEIDLHGNKFDKNGNLRKPFFLVKPVWLSPTSSVHEDLLKESFNLARIHNRSWNTKAKPESDEMSYMKGVYWNDSPERNLCIWCSTITANFRALRWGVKFKAAQKAANTGKIFTHGSSVFKRSHYGDLAFIHGMATKNRVLASDTLRKIMIWAEFSYKVATGKIRATTKMSDVKVRSFSLVFNKLDKDIIDHDVTYLFRDPHDAKMVMDLKRIGIGSLLHLIQDSYSPAHIERENFDPTAGRFCRGKIKRFLAYPNQVTNKHADADKWPKNLPRKTLKTASRICDPITAGARIMKFYAENDFAGADWARVKKFLEKKVFAIDDDALVSGPGKDFKN